MSNNTLENWEEKTLCEVCTITAGQSPESQFYNTEGKGLPFYQGKKEFTNKYIGDPTVWTTKITKEAFAGDILMSVRAPVGPINYATQKCCIGRGLASIRKSEKISNDFLFYYLLSIQKEIGGHDGAVFNSISRNEIATLKIKLPPLQEQQRIVGILDEAFENIEKAKQNALQNLNNAKELYKNIQSSIFNEPFEKKELGEICTLYQGLAINAKTKHLLCDKSSLPLLRIKDLKENCETQFVKEEGFPENALVDENDIIYTRTGSLGLVFKGRKGILHNNSFKVIPNNLIDNDYLFEWLQNPIFNQQIIELAQRAAQPDITHTLFKQQIINIPPLDIQLKKIKEIRAIREQTKKLEQIYEQKIKDLDELKQSILKKAFNG